MRNELFDRVLGEYRGSIIAGGAVRDWLLDKPIADIDVWAGLDDRPLITSAPKKDDTYDGVACIVVAKTTETRPWCPYPLHIMLTSGGGLESEPERVLRGFDYGLCMVAYTQDGLFCTPEFVRDVFYKRLTLVNGTPHTNCRNSGKGDVIDARIAKLGAKFPGWRFVDGGQP